MPESMKPILAPDEAVNLVQPAVIAEPTAPPAEVEIPWYRFRNTADNHIEIPAEDGRKAILNLHGTIETQNPIWAAKLNDLIRRGILPLEKI